MSRIFVDGSWHDVSFERLCELDRIASEKKCSREEAADAPKPKPKKAAKKAAKE